MKLLILSLLLMGTFFSACNENIEDERAVEKSAIKIEMQMNKVYTLYSGDKIQKTVEPTVIKVRKNSNSALSEATLIEGAAVIIRK